MKALSGYVVQNSQEEYKSYNEIIILGWSSNSSTTGVKYKSGFNLQTWTDFCSRQSNRFPKYLKTNFLCTKVYKKSEEYIRIR